MRSSGFWKYAILLIALSKPLNLCVRRFVIEPPQETHTSSWGFFSLQIFVWCERSVRTVWHPLCLFHALGSVDLLIDKQQLIRNKVFKANGLCGSNTINVSVKHQFKGKIFGFGPKNESFFPVKLRFLRLKRGALSDNLEQPHLLLYPRPLRRYQICSHDPVLSFEFWICPSTLLRMVRLLNHFGFRASYFVFVQIQVTSHEQRATIRPLLVHYFAICASAPSTFSAVNSLSYFLTGQICAIFVSKHSVLHKYICIYLYTLHSLCSLRLINLLNLWLCSLWPLCSLWQKNPVILSKNLCVLCGKTFSSIKHPESSIEHQHILDFHWKNTQNLVQYS